MALSTLLRSSMCMNRMVGVQALRVSARPAPLVKLVTQNPTAVRPVLSSVRAFQTSAARLSAAQHDHSRKWLLEKLLALALVPLVPAAIAFPNKVLDSILAVAIVAHSFWGLEAIAIDYVRAIIFGPVLPKVAIGLVYLVSFATLGGLFYVIQHDIGVANSIRKLWSIKAQQ